MKTCGCLYISAKSMQWMFWQDQAGHSIAAILQSSNFTKLIVMLSNSPTLLTTACSLLTQAAKQEDKTTPFR
jgi:hypothetical protein